MAVEEDRIQPAGMAVGRHIVVGGGVGFSVNIVIDQLVGAFIADHPVRSVRELKFGGGAVQLGVAHSPVYTVAVFRMTGQTFPVESVGIRQIRAARVAGRCGGACQRGIGADQAVRPEIHIIRTQLCVRAQLKNPAQTG